MNTNNDHKIVQSVLDGDKEAYAGLVIANQARMINYCRMLMPNSAEAEDAAQDVFVKAYESLSKFRGESSFSTWLYRIAHNHCMDQLRKKSRQKTDSLEALLDQNPANENNFIAKENNQSVESVDTDVLKKILSTLRAEYREILMLREVGNLSYDEITVTLQCSLDAVKARLRRAREELQEKARHFSELKTV